MKIKRVELLATNLTAQANFYADVLGLPITQAGDVLTVTIGASELAFRQAGSGFAGIYHVAFNIPENQLAKGKAWLASRWKVTRSAEGADEFHFVSWNAHAAYFTDPAGNILELISRHDLPNATDKPFTEASLLNISEIGLVVEDVPATVAELQKQIDVTPYREGSEQFATLGDENGLFIVVKRGRVWFATEGLVAEPSPLTVTVQNGDGETFTLQGLPFQIEGG